MRSLSALTVSILLVLTIVGCEKKGPAPETAAPASSAVSADENTGIVILDQLGFYDIAEGAAKWKASLDLGEKVALPGEAAKATLLGKERDFVKVQRGGADGWAFSAYVIPNCILGVVTDEEAIIYDQPKNTAPSKKSLPKITLFVIHKDSAASDFIRITTIYPADKTLLKDAYLKNQGLSTKTEDVESAILLQLSGRTGNVAKQKATMLKSAMDDYPTSVFFPIIKEQYDALTAPPPEQSEKATEPFSGILYSAFDKVNVRDAPDETTGSVVASLSKGQAVQVAEKTTEEFTVGDKTAPWYRTVEPAGWAFGAFLSVSEPQ